MDTPTMGPRTVRHAYAGIFLLAASIILFEITLTRVFAIMMWHHFAYMVVSIALLGFGAAGSILTARRDATRAESPVGSLVLFSAGYGLAAMFAYAFVTLIRIDTLEIWTRKSNILALLLVFMIIAVPMLLGGLAIGQALTRMAKHVNRLYFADLLGSAAGGGLSVLVLSTFDSATTIMIAGALGCLAALLFGMGGRPRHVIGAIPPLVVASAIALGFTGGWEAVGLGPLSWPVPFAPSKEFASYAEKTDARLPSAVAEVEVTTSVPLEPKIGGNFGALDRTIVAGRMVAQDGTAPTMLYENAADVQSFPFLDDTQAASAYVAYRARGGTRPNVLAIGVGGGVDVMVALAHDAEKVTAVEINQAMIDMVTDRYADYIGHLFTPGAHPLSDRITLVNREGRSYMRHHDERYDVIQMSGVDSFTALSTGAYTLAESYLYTKEAVQEFYEHLEDGGYVNYSRFVLNHPKKPRETMRLANIARVALDELGVEDPAAHIAVFQGMIWASTMIKRGPFTGDELAALDEFAAKEGFLGLIYDPRRRSAQEIGLEPDSRAVLEREFASLFTKSGGDGTGGSFPVADPAGIARVLADAYLHRFAGDDAAAAAVLAPVLGQVPEAGREAARATVDGVLDHRLGIGRRRARILRDKQRDFTTLIAGSPSERAAFVAGYDYDITPCTDDKPFFFNYYRYDQLFGRVLGGGSEGEGESSAVERRYHPNFPVGHAVLLASLAQIAVLAVLMILLPLRRLRRDGVRTPGKLRYFTYFAALGLGFMFIEIVLMQKMVIFLGHPTYALSVVLTSLLGFAGVGSFLAGRLQRLGRRDLMLILGAVLLAIALEVAVVNFLLPALLGWALPLRVVCVVLCLVPLGLALGMPFPTGIRILERDCPALLPWGWAINGFLSVLGSILCIVMSQLVGFTLVLYAAAAIYAVGFLAMKPGSTPPEPSGAA